MEKLDLNDTVDACVCCLDSVNHVTSPARSAGLFPYSPFSVFPAALFFFDITVPVPLWTWTAACIWTKRRYLLRLAADYSTRRRLCSFGMDIFRRDGDLWRREREEHEEYAYTPEELTGFFERGGFTSIRQYGNLN